MRSQVKRISVVVGQKEYEKMVEKGLNISSFIRDLIGDYFSDHTINIAVSKKTYDLYNKVVSNSGATDQDIEPFLIEVLKKLLNERLKKIEQLKTEFK